jgi:hypothetical protein
MCGHSRGNLWLPMSAYSLRRRAGAALLFLWPAFASAHKPSDSYLALSVLGDTVSGQWDISLRDLDFAIGLDADNDGEITWGEVKRKHKEIAAYAMARLAIGTDRVACPATVTGQLIDNHSDGAYAVLRFTAACPHAPVDLQLTYLRHRPAAQGTFAPGNGRDGTHGGIWS